MTENDTVRSVCVQALLLSPLPPAFVFVSLTRMFSFTPARVGAIARYFAASVCAPFASAASSSIAAGISTAAGQQQQQQQTHFDLVVIGGGSGGLACAQQAAGRD